MSDILKAFGVGGDDLSSQLDHAAYPEHVPGRVAHIDADFISYQVSAETKDEIDGIKPRRSLEDMRYNARVAALHLMKMAGAVTYTCHVTPSGSNKGGRGDQAVQQEYQANRAARDNRPEHLDAIRHYIGTELNGCVHLDQEADDGMAQCNYYAEDRNLSVIVSKDKDLRMVPGLHFDFDSETVVDVVDAFGTIWVDDTKSSKTMKGWGTKFFWAQCLMGDTADHIKGIPAIPGSVHCNAAPTQAYQKAYSALAGAAGTPMEAAARARVDAIESKTKQCGVVLTYELLKDIQSDREAFNFVRDVWNKMASEHGHEFVHWKTGKPVTPTQALLGDMQLLWMRRNKNPLDVVEWLKERI